MKNAIRYLKQACLFLPLISVLLGCTPIVSKDIASPEIVEQTIVSMATLYTPESIVSTPVLLVSLTAIVTRSNTQFLESETELCEETKGKIDIREIVIPESNHPFAFRIYLPPCYDEQAEPGYPVLYLLHGQMSKDDHWDRLGIDEAADQMISSGEIAPTIIVMPWEANSLEEVKVSLFGNILVDRLIPLVDNEYATCIDQKCRAIGGISRGAGWAMRVGLTHWELFGAIGVHSFAPFSGDFYNAPYWFKAIPEDRFPRIYMDMGATDALLDTARLFEDRLTKYSVPHEWVINRGTHNDEYWAAHVEDYLRWYSFTWRDIFWEKSFDLSPVSTDPP